MTATQEIIDRFPSFATILKIPEVADLLEKAAQPGNTWSPAFFQAQLWDTTWWKSQSESQRTWQSRKLIDPATAGAQARALSSNVIAASMALGIHLTPAEVTWYTEIAAQNAWDEKELTRQLVDHTARARYHAGAVTATQSSLKSTAGNYAVPISDKTTFDWAKKIAEGSSTTQAFEEYVRTHAKAAFPTLQKEIDAGFTVRQLADPYMQIAGQTLGLNPETLSLHDPKWQRSLQSRDKDGKITGPMTTLDWQRTLMTDKAYGYDFTQNGRGAALQMKDALGKTFGLTA